MNVQRQIEEYRKRQAERFMKASQEEDRDDSQEELKEAERVASESEEQQKKRAELQDLEIAQRLERELNFRSDYQFEEEIGEEGNPPNLPRASDRNHMKLSNNEGRIGSLLDRNKFIKRDPPKWLLQPVKIDKDNKIKVYDFTNGSLNNELRKTNDTDVQYE